ncbi:hypothetical protein GPL17_35880, partial [Bradyrhizobium yuanmingense]|nr:hypothetical protein [Bradyrhizobium yuanmingense]
LSSWGIPPRRHPLPNPLPQAGEGAHLLVAASNLISSRVRASSSRSCRRRSR